MDDQPVVHVVADGHGALAPLLRKGLAETATVRTWQGCPTASLVAPTDCVLVVLDDTPAELAPQAANALLGRASLILVAGTKPVAPRWLEVAARPGVTVVTTSSAALGSQSAIILSEVSARIRGPTGDELAALVLAREPVFQRAPHLVRAICLQTWHIRRPRDLASATGLHPNMIRRQCWTAGFERVEHFIVCVRVVAYEQLVLEARMPRASARVRAGFADCSNMRRHLSRALRRSPRAAEAMQSLPKCRVNATELPAPERASEAPWRYVSSH